MKVRDYEMPTDNQFKDDLRKELLFLKELLEYLDNKEYDRIRKKLNDNIDRVEQSLQD